MKEINKVTVKSERVKCFDEKIEGYKMWKYRQKI